MNKKVVKLKDVEAEKRDALREMARKAAEVCAKLEPSKEAKEWFDAELAADPDEWRLSGDLTAEATRYALDAFCWGYASKASILHGAELLKTELGYDDASPMIKLLIEQAVLCHIRLGIVEHSYSCTLKGSYSLVVAAHWEMRITICQRRYMKALTTLAKVRGLLARAELAEAHAAMRRPHTMKVLKSATG